MKPGTQLKRRGFIGAALVGFGGALGWLTRQFQSSGDPRSVAAAPADRRVVYDVSEFETTDPALLRYGPGHHFETGFSRVKRLVAAPGNRVWVAGDRAVKLFDAEGRLEKTIPLDRPPHCLHIAGADEFYIGLGNSYEVYDAAGDRLLRTPRLGENTFLTAMAVHRKTVYLADAGRREVLMCNRDNGAVVGSFGRRDRENPGFEVPSPYFDLAVGPDGRLRVVNPGRLRVETYSLDGRFESSWGAPGMQIDRFCGCCNPVYFTITPQGDFITSEKGLARINLYSADGVFKGAVAGPGVMVADRELARRSCVDCRIGAGFDVTFDENGRVLALDPFRQIVRFFEPRPEAQQV